MLHHAAKLLTGAAMFTALGGTAIAAQGLIGAKDIGRGAVTSAAIKDGTIQVHDLRAGTRALLTGPAGSAGATGPTGVHGANGANGPTAANGTPGAPGVNGAAGPSGSSGASGTNGAAGANGPNGANGIDGTNGTNGTNGTAGTDGTDGTIAPLFATAGVVAIPTSASATVVSTLAVPAGNYVVLAKSQISHTGAGDSVDCVLKSAATTIDQVTMKTLPALAAIPMSLQAVVTVASPSNLTVECHVATANGSASFNSLIAIPTA